MGEGGDSGAMWPEAADIYLDNLAVPVGPDGQKMTKGKAAELAGVSYSSVKNWRDRHAGFREAEEEAQRGRRRRNAQRLADMYLRVLITPAGRQVWRNLESDEPDLGLAWKVLETAAEVPKRVEVEQGQRLERLLRDLREMEDEEEGTDEDNEV